MDDRIHSFAMLQKGSYPIRALDLFFYHLFNIGLLPLPRPITDARDKLISAYVNTGTPNLEILPNPHSVVG